MDIASRASLLRETAEHHDPYEALGPVQLVGLACRLYGCARARGGTPGEASKAAGRYMEEVLHISAL